MSHKKIFKYKYDVFYSNFISLPDIVKLAIYLLRHFIYPLFNDILHYGVLVEKEKTI